MGLPHEKDGALVSMKCIIGEKSLLGAACSAHCRGHAVWTPPTAKVQDRQLERMERIREGMNVYVRYVTSCAARRLGNE